MSKLYLGENSLTGVVSKQLTLDAEATTKEIKDESGNVLTYSQIFELISNKSLSIAVVVSESVLCYPSVYDGSSIEFTNTYKREGKTYFDRVIINSDNDVLWEEVEGQEALTDAQLSATNSGITSSKVTTYDGYATSKQDKLTAGNNITISGNTISANVTLGYEEVE